MSIADLLLPLLAWTVLVRGQTAINCTAPGTATNLVVSEVGPTMFTFSWEAPEETSGCEVGSYEYCWTNLLDQVRTCEVGDSLNHTVSGTWPCYTLHPHRHQSGDLGQLRDDPVPRYKQPPYPVSRSKQHLAPVPSSKQPPYPVSRSKQPPYPVSRSKQPPYPVSRSKQHLAPVSRYKQPPYPVSRSKRPVESPVTEYLISIVNTHYVLAQWARPGNTNCNLVYWLCWRTPQMEWSLCIGTDLTDSPTMAYNITTLLSCMDYTITINSVHFGEISEMVSQPLRTPVSMPVGLYTSSALANYATEVGKRIYRSSRNKEFNLLLTRKCFCPESLSELTATSVTDTSFLVGWVVPEDSARCGHTLDVCSTHLATDHRYCSLNATGSQWQRTDLTPCSVYHVSAVLTVLTHTFPPRNLTVTTARPDYTMILSTECIGSMFQMTPLSCQQNVLAQCSRLHHDPVNRMYLLNVPEDTMILSTECIGSIMYWLNVPDDAMLLSAQVDSVTTNEITLSWVPVYSGSPCALGYRLCWLPVDQDNTTQGCRTDVSREVNSFTLTGLQSLTNYTVEVAAWFGEDQVSESVNVEARTTGAAVALIVSHLLLFVCVVTSLGITSPTDSSPMSSPAV
uniref:Fibronectin type-III domain-containing protein n=1 Tax=Timema douglasi TaxID=61478 RepID=A0A7R8VSV3_TIMDO|nr:unnamed protein product [Timema douglasi]